MLSLRQIRRRIKSVENTKKMTRAMEMVAAAKLKKLQDLLKQSDRYIGELRRILGTLVREKPLAHPLLEKRVEPKSTLAFLITSDTGLCGSYNTNILERASQLIRTEAGKTQIFFVSVGKNGAAYLRRTKQTIFQELTIPKPSEIEETICKVTQIAKDEFVGGQDDRVIFIYTKAASLGSLKPGMEQLFPFDSGNEQEVKEGKIVDYLIEPSLDQVLDIMLPEFIEAKVGQFVKHSLVSEQASRMMAMRQATDNAKEMRSEEHTS